MAAFDLAIMTRSVGTDFFMRNTHFTSSSLKKRFDFAAGSRESVGKFEAVVCLYTFYRDVVSAEVSHRLAQEIGGRVSRLFLMDKNWKIVDGHIVAKVPLSQELPTMRIELQSGRTIYRFSGSYDGTHSLPAKVLRLMDKDGDIDGEKPDEA